MASLYQKYKHNIYQGATCRKCMRPITKFSKSGCCNSCRNKERPNRSAPRPNRSEEHKRNISNALKGRKFSAAHRKNLSIAFSKKKLSEEHKQKIRATFLKKIENGYQPAGCGAKQCKRGHHITWDKRKVFYRSGYELLFCKELDKEKIPYEVETVRIRYFDSQRQKERIAIPDFYLPLTNTLVEVKGSFYFDKKNLEDRLKIYILKGYKFRLILDKKEVDVKMILNNELS